MTDISADMTTMPAYSERRKSPKRRPVYSVMWPKMISESATGMSNGGRLSSASAAVKNTMMPGPRTTSHHHSHASAMPVSDIVPASMTTLEAQSTSGSS